MTTKTPDSFPHQLLRSSKSRRLEYFRSFTIQHSLLLRAYDELRCAIRDSNHGSIIFIYGPTGVGKTTLLERTEKHWKEMLLPELENDPERIPIVKVQLAAPSSGNFDWKDYFKRLLLEFKEPLSSYKLDRSHWHAPPSSSSFKDEGAIKFVLNERTGIRPIRFASEQTLKHRRPIAVLIDDAQYFGIISSGRRLLDQVNTIKSLADESKVTHVLCGTYELSPLRNLNGQLSRRSIDIHFGRYHADNEEDMQEFIDVLYTFQQHLPLPDTPDLVSRWDYFYERSLGCVGVLKDWITSSFALALESDCPTLPLDYIERRALTVPQCATMLQEAKVGEKELDDGEAGRSLLRQGLGLAHEIINEQSEVSSQNPEEVPVVEPRKRRRRVGARKPVRDKTGVKAS